MLFKYNLQLISLSNSIGSMQEYLYVALPISAVFLVSFLVWKMKFSQQTKTKVIESTDSQKPTKNAEEIKVQEIVVPIKKAIKMKSSQQLQEQYPELFHNSFRIKQNKSVHSITAVCLKGSKLLFADTKNQLVLMDLKKLKRNQRKASEQQVKPQNNSLDRFFVNLGNNTATAIAIGKQFYYAALNFDRTIVYYEFRGGENGIYFREVFRFPRNIFKSSAASLWVSEQQKYLVTTGFDADTVIDIWSMKGQKLSNINTYQIQQYQFSYGMHDIIVRGWTSQAKIFIFTEQKDGSFKSIDKKMHVAHDESPMCCVIDNLSMYALSITKNHSLRLWPIHSQFLHQSHQSKFFEFANDVKSEYYISNLNKCMIYSQEYLPGHVKTLIVAANDHEFILLDKNLNLLKKVEGVQCEQLEITGGKKSVVMGIINKKGQVTLWNLKEQIDRCQQLKI